MPWDIQTETITSNNASQVTAGSTWKMGVEKLPLVQVAYVNGATTNSRTLDLEVEVSADGTTWTNIGLVVDDGTSSATALVDTAIFSSKPTGAPYFRLNSRASGAISGAETIVSVCTLAWWVDNVEQSAGVRSPN